MIIEDTGLVAGHALIVAGCEPVLLLPDWGAGRWREREIAYLLATQWIEAHGWPQAAHDQTAVLTRLGARAEAVA